MTTETSPLNRQPSKLDYSSPTQFRFLINQLPKVQYFTVAANIPGLSLNETSYATPLKDIPLIGEKLNYEDLTITFIVDENLENYIELHNWITSLGFPKDRSQFKSFRETTANTKVTSQGTSSDIGDVKPATAERSMFSDATLSILTNKNNTEVINKIEAPSLTEAVILLAKIKQLDPDKLLNIYKVIKQTDNHGR